MPGGVRRLRRPLGLARHWASYWAEARSDLRVPGQERGPQPALGAAADVRGGAARRPGRQRVRRRHARGGPAGGRVGRSRRPLHPGVVPLPGQPGRHRAPHHPARLGPLADPLLQLVLQPRAHDVLHEVGRRHGADPRGRRLPRRPVVAARGLQRRGGDPASPAVDRQRVGGVDRPRLQVPRAVGLPDGPGVHLRQGLRVGGARVPRHLPADRRARGPVRGAEVARRRRVRPLEQRRATSTGRARRARPASGTSTPPRRGPRRRGARPGARSRRRRASTSSTS